MSALAFVAAGAAKIAVGVALTCWGLRSSGHPQGRPGVCAAAVLIFACAYAVLRFAYVSQFYMEGPVGLCLVTSLLAVVAFGYRPAVAVYLGCSLSLCLQASQLAVFTVAGTILPGIDELLSRDGWFGLILEVASGLVAVIPVALMRRELSAGADRWIRSGHLSLLVVPLAIFIFFSAWQLPSFDGRFPSLELAPIALIAIVFLAIVFSVLILFVSLRMSWQRSEIARLEVAAASRHERMVLRQADSEELHRFLHDFRNQILCAEAMRDADARDTHLRRLDERLEALSTTRFTGNDTLDALLSQKRSEARALGIDFCVTPLAIPALPLDSVEVCTLFGNALDNAMEGCGRLESGVEPYVDVRMTRVGNYLSVAIVNPCVAEPRRAGDGFVSSKREGNRIGIGVVSMRRVVEKYGGAIQFGFRRGEFSVAWLLPWVQA